MGRPKKELKVKEPIRIRERKLANGNLSLYLDIYVKGSRKYESLGLFIIPDSAPNAKALNLQARKVAEKIKAERILALQERGIRNWDKVKRSTMALVDFLKDYENDSFGFSRSTLQGRADMRKKVEEFLTQEKMMYIGMNEVNADFCREFLKFLATAKNSVAKKQKDRTINAGCAHHHQAVFNGALNKAVRDGIIDFNPMKNLEKREKFQSTYIEREYLTIDELRTLMKTPCPSNEEVKRAFICSCFIGLRLGDLRGLCWRKILTMPDGKTLYVHVFMEKPKKWINVPLSDEALKYLGEKKEDLDEKIFALPSSDATINHDLKVWMKSAGINKKITFHCSRHSFATMMLTLSSDIYTTSQLLGHANVTTTQIYAKIVDKKKLDTVTLVDGLFDNNNENPEGLDVASESNECNEDSEFSEVNECNVD